MRRFVLRRQADITGISGTGDVAEGVEFSTGEVAIKWKGKFWSVVFYLNIETVEAVHGHNGATLVVFLDNKTDPGERVYPLDNKKPEDQPC